MVQTKSIQRNGAGAVPGLGRWLLNAGMHPTSSRVLLALQNKSLVIRAKPLLRSPGSAVGSSGLTQPRYLPLRLSVLTH